jgi:hypothetical protein
MPFFFPAYIFPTHFSRLRVPADSFPVIFPAHAFPPFLVEIDKIDPCLKVQHKMNLL